jgi:hypothetical protein
MKRFSVHFNLHKSIQIVFFKIFKIVGPLSKMKSCTKRVPQIGKKTLESCIGNSNGNSFSASTI